MRQFTSVPADLYGLVGRGRLEEGAWADVVLFDPANVAATPLETVHDLPSGSARLLTRATGVERVLVGGREVVVGGAFTGDGPGRVLRSGRDTRTVAARAT